MSYLERILIQYGTEEQRQALARQRKIQAEQRKGIEEARKAYYKRPPKEVDAEEVTEAPVPAPAPEELDRFRREPAREVTPAQMIAEQEAYREAMKPVIPAPKPPAVGPWQEVTLAGQLASKGLMGMVAERLQYFLPEEKRQEYLRRMGIVSEVIEPKHVPVGSQTLAGIVAGPERYVRMMRGEPAPPMPVSAVVGTVIGRPGELQQLEEVGWQYGAGALMWEGIEAILVGKAVAKPVSVVTKKAWTGLKKVTPEFVKTAFKFGRPARLAHRVHMWWIQHRPWQRLARAPARGEVALKYLPERVGMKELRASEMAWRMTIAPRTGGVLIRQFPAITKGPQLYISELVVRGGVAFYRFRPARVEEFIKTPAYKPLPTRLGYTKLYFKKATLPMFEHRGLLPYVTQAQVTRLGIHPYVPKAVSFAGKRAVHDVSKLGLGLGVVAITRRPLEVVKPVPIQRKRREVTPRRKRREVSLTIPAITPGVAPIITQLEEQRLAQPQIITTKQKQRFAPVLKHDFPVISFPARPPARPPRPRVLWHRLADDRARKRREKAFFGKWFKREHALPTAKEMARRFGL